MDWWLFLCMDSFCMFWNPSGSFVQLMIAALQIAVNVVQSPQYEEDKEAIRGKSEKKENNSDVQ